MAPTQKEEFKGDKGLASPQSNGGKSPGTQVQHTLSIGTKGTEFRRFLASKCGTVRAITKSARGFAPIAHVTGRVQLGQPATADGPT